MIVELNRTNEVEQFRVGFEQRKIYNSMERKYIENEKIREEMGEEYDSDSSDDDDRLGSFAAMSKYEIKSMLRENLLKLKFDEQKLPVVEMPSVEEEETEREFVMEK